jgi:hypothetical protein
MHAVDAHIRGVRWEGEFTVSTPGCWQFSIEAWNEEPKILVRATISSADPARDGAPVLADCYLEVR